MFKNPLTGQPIRKLEFEVKGHDHLVLTSPPALCRMASVRFYDYDRLHPLLTQIGTLLDQRVAALQRFSSRLQQMGIEGPIDRENARIVAQPYLPHIGTVMIHADENGVYAVGCQPAKPSAEPMEFDIPLDMDELSSKEDLDIYLGHKLLALSQVRETKHAVSSPAPTAEAATVAGFSNFAPLEFRGVPGQFRAQLEQGDTFSGSFTTSKGVQWSGQFRLTSFPGVTALLEQALGGESSDALPPPRPDSSPWISQLGPGYRVPRIGEIWVMNLAVEEDSETEIRYVPIDIDGTPFGAPRVLPKKIFLETFMRRSSDSYCLLARVESVEAGKVGYVQLSPDRQQVGRRILTRMVAFLANFVPDSDG